VDKDDEIATLMIKTQWLVEQVVQLAPTIEIGESMLGAVRGD